VIQLRKETDQHRHHEQQQQRSKQEADRKRNEFMSLATAAEHQRKAYNADDFKETKQILPLGFSNSPPFDATFARAVLEETEDLKTKLTNAYKEIQLNQHEFESRVKQLSSLNEKTCSELKSKHRYEVDKLLKLLMSDKTGFLEEANHSEFMKFTHEYNGSSGGSGLGSVLDDPAYMRLLIKASENFQGKRLASLMETNRLLNENMTEFRVFMDKCRRLEEANSGLKRRVSELESEIERLRRSSGGNELVVLAEKLRVMEARYAQREREIDSIMNGGGVRDLVDVAGSGDGGAERRGLVAFYENELKIKNKEIEKFQLELSSMLQLLHSLRN
jgi:hypothetical protein